MGDHAAEHCGCQAVTEVIHRNLSKHGVIVDHKDPYDVLIVNGEGSMHHGKRNFTYKMHQIRLAQLLGKPTHLINSLWQENPSDFDEVLNKLSEIWVRGTNSAQDLQQNHGITARHYIDLSYYAEIDPSAESLDFRNEIVATDVYAEGFGFVWLPPRKAIDLTNIDMRELSWSSLVNSLSTAKLLITGRHHGMYAACRARLPFVPIRGNSHKIEDLLSTAKSPIPIAKSITDAVNLITWAINNRSAYDDLFAWMDEQSPWRFEILEKQSEPERVFALPNRTLIERANDAFAKRNYDEALPLWSKLLKKRGKNLPYPKNACKVFFESNQVDVGMSILANARLSKPKSIIFTKLLMQFARHPTIWLERNAVPEWWDCIREAASRASVGDAEGFHTFAECGLKSAQSVHGNVFASSINFFLACRLVRLNAHVHAFELRTNTQPADTPQWIIDQEDILLNGLCRRASPEVSKLLALAPKLDCWADPSFRATVVRQRMMIEGVSSQSLENLSKHIEAFPKHPELRNLMLSQIGEAQEWGLLQAFVQSKKAQGFSLPELERSALQHLPLAEHLVSQSLTNEPAVRKRSELFKAFCHGRDKLIQMLSDQSLRIAVVGNSPVELGKSKGKEIDQYDIVVRFNEFSIQSPFDVDYGSKTDVSIQSYRLHEDSAQNCLSNKTLLVQRHAFNIFDPRDWSPVLDTLAQGYEIAFLQREMFTLAATKLGFAPSAGFALAIYLKHLRGRINRADFFGFSFTDQLGEQQKAHYFNQEPPSLLHNWQLERQEFEKLF